MMKKFVITIMAALSLLSIGAPIMVSADTSDQVKIGVCTGSENPAECEKDDGSRVNDLVKLALRIFEVVVGLISVFVIIFAGLRFVTSGGDSSKIASARNTILYALIGIAIVVLSETIVQFVLNRVGAAPGV